MIEINVVDQVNRKGYRFKGRAVVLGEGPEYEALLAFFRRRGSTSAKRHIVVMTVERATPLISPAYDDGRPEAAVVAQWLAYWRKLWRRRGRRSEPA